jgi:hypothetical protein
VRKTWASQATTEVLPFFKRSELTLWARALAHRRRSAIFTAFAKRRFDGPSRIFPNGMCLSTLSIPKLCGVIGILLASFVNIPNNYTRTVSACWLSFNEIPIPALMNLRSDALLKEAM